MRGAIEKSLLPVVGFVVGLNATWEEPTNAVKGGG